MANSTTTAASTFTARAPAAAPFLKKSYDIDGNRGYRFKWSMDPAVPRAKDINLLTIYADKTKIRHGLAYEMNREAGVAAHYCFSHPLPAQRRLRRHL